MRKIISVSGGKDSTAVALLAMERSANGTATYYYSKGHEGVWAKVLWANTYIKRGRPKKEAIDGGTRL